MMTAVSRRMSLADFTLPLGLVTAMVLAFSLFVVTLLVDQFDRTALQRERLIVEKAVAEQMQRIAASVLPQIMWDDAVRNIDNRLDRRWISENLGTYLHKTSRVDFVTVEDGDGRALYHSVDGIDTRKPIVDPQDRQIRALIDRVRRSESMRGPLRSVPKAGSMIAPPIQASSIVALDGSVYAVVATLVAPDFGRAWPIAKMAPIVITGVRFDDRLVQPIGERLLLEGAHIHPWDAGAEPMEGHALLRDAAGNVVASMDWQPGRPGLAMLRRLGAPLGAITLVLFAVMAALHLRSRRIAQGLIASEARATHIAYHDGLTGLPNRARFIRGLKDGLSRIDRTGETVIVLCLDLDRFKEINDTFGHLVGDELIGRVAERLSSQCRSHELLARLSGDEFAIIQIGATAAQAARLAGRLCRAMARPFDLSMGELHVGCSIGIALSENSEVEPAELLRQADLALYRAKQTGRGRFCFFEAEIDALIKARRLLEDELRTALGDGQLRLAYQPQVDGHGAMKGVEALLRWDHPERGDISPAIFVPVAEQCGLIRELGVFALRRAFEDSHRWPGLRIAVNVSAQQIQAKDFLLIVARLVEETGADPASFDLEITEGILLRDDPQLRETLEGLRHLGFTLALDDFGTGYSSLSYLRSYPISKIKIDRSFICNIWQEDTSREVVSAMIKLARALRLSVIAEGVETAEQHGWLAAAGCPDVQGFLFGGALTTEEIDRLWWLTHGKQPVLSSLREAVR